MRGFNTNCVSIEVTRGTIRVPFPQQVSTHSCLAQASVPWRLLEPQLVLVLVLLASA